MERLQKYIANCGVTSRRKAEELILQGKVKINGEVVIELGIKIDPEVDIVEVDGHMINANDKKIYIKLNKPTEIITSVKDQFGRKCVIDLIDIEDRIYPVGRLDYDTSGLLLLTNDGEIANVLMHPKFEVYKTYVAKVKGRMNSTDIGWLKHGVKIEDYTSAPAHAEIISTSKEETLVKISIHEGRNRQVRKMLAAVGKEVLSLERISFGEIELSELKNGEWQHLTKAEVDYLKGLI